MSHLELGFLSFVTQSIPWILIQHCTLSIVRIKDQVGEEVTDFKDRKTSPNPQAKIESISPGTQTVSDYVGPQA